MRVKIRGIYTTALTALLLKQGLTIVQPTLPIRERFNLPLSQLPEEVYIHDRADKHGVMVQGERTEEVIKLLKGLLPEAIFRTTAVRLNQLSGLRLSWEEFQKLARGHEIEFPYQVKIALDEIRGSITPTIREHHLLKVINAEEVEISEMKLKGFPEKAEELNKELKEKLIYRSYYENADFSIYHVKLSGSVFTAKAQIEESEIGRVVLRRGFRKGGFYNGLNLAKEEGDWGIIELREGSWWHRRRYFSAKGELKGEIYNINTPVEFYPTSARYIDLEVDVIRVGDEVRIIDKEKIEREAKKGIISYQLKEKALKIAEQLSLSGFR